MLSRNETILAKIETTVGTDSSPVGTDAVELAGIVQANPAEQARFTDRPVIRGGSIGKGSPLFGGSLFGITIDVEFKHSGVAATEPEWGVLLRACGFAKTAPASNVVYKPKSSAHESCTIYYYMDGVRWRVTGCRGNVSFRGEVGSPMIMTFSMIGRLNASDPTDSAAPSVTLDGTVPPVFLANNFLSLGAYNPRFGEYTLDMQNKVTPGVNANAADGFGEIAIAERDPRGTLDPEMTLVATQNWIGDWKAGNTKVLTLTLGTAGGNRFVISHPVLRYIEPSFDDRDGIRAVGLGFKADETGALNDEISLVLD